MTSHEILDWEYFIVFFLGPLICLWGTDWKIDSSMLLRISIESQNPNWYD